MDQFGDPYAPTAEEIRTWAYAAECDEPVQDWEVILSWHGFEQLYLDLADDASCPKRQVSLMVIYRMVGDAVRSGFVSTPRPVIEGFVARGASCRSSEVSHWHAEAQALLKNPETFDYDRWFGKARRDAI